MAICENCEATATRRFCSDRCRQRARKSQKGLRYRTGLGKAKPGHFSVDITSEFQPLQAISKNPPLRCERVNEVTYKITHGEMTSVPASHGQWGGYRTSRAVAWVMNIAPGQWLARYRDQCCGPSSIAQAKAGALRMARGKAGDWMVRNPIAELNELQAILIDRRQ
jgi:hypothetical protein